MTQTKTYHIPPTPLIPNSPHPILHYPGLLLPLIQSPSFTPLAIHTLFKSNDWHTQWIVRYDVTQPAHYHATTHEVMAVISGEGATIRIGVADLESESSNDNHEKGGIEIQAQLGDVFVVPAGVAHKTYNPVPESKGFEQLLRADGHLGSDEEAEKRLKGVRLDGGFMMMGAYPEGCDWDWGAPGEWKGREEEVWNVKVPERDPVLGSSGEGMVGLWRKGKGKL
ncbi:hypothetical protein M011DRAFT_466091 [Sporormia fimetaria CBS 119925]|uniref:Cupin type-1 domain-containing protein n=1 Tax=Sporormia fimetaria CBS 119925 TaxID=1340428 RepID=A0A6A6VEB0_9PLEO|nr:hypothetical protein M011DRAFT_466091 [Sporormia fimetaria CBS 119925]